MNYADAMSCGKHSLNPSSLRSEQMAASPALQLAKRWSIQRIGVRVPSSASRVFRESRAGV
jgi:hypothetical protein